MRCDFCGWCDTPGRCVWSIECPLCAVGPKEQCRVPGTTRIEGLHAERWAAVGLDWRALDEIAEVVLSDPPRVDARVVDSVLYLLDDWEELRRIEEGAATT